MTRIVFVYWLWGGFLHLTLKELHDKYGDVVRVAPDELSFIDGRAWEPLYTGHIRNKGLPKNPVVFGAQQFRSILDGGDGEHTRMRKILGHSFSTQTMLRQEPMLKQYLQSMISRIRELSAAGSSVDVVRWFHFLTFDMTGELAFSESFDQLEHKAYHPWVEMIFSHLKYSAISIGLRYFPPLHWLMPLIAPPALRRLKWLFVSMSRDKVYRRVQRQRTLSDQDILGHCLSDDGTPLMMSMDELVGTFSFMIVAGSETTATVLAGLMNYLCRDSVVLRKLQAEVRAVPDATDLSIHTTADLPYLTACIKEALRLCYPIPGALSRVVQGEGSLICGHYVPSGVSPI